jgi:hypothetical protein
VKPSEKMDTQEVGKSITARAVVTDTAWNTSGDQAAGIAALPGRDGDEVDRTYFREFTRCGTQNWVKAYGERADVERHCH